MGWNSKHVGIYIYFDDHSLNRSSTYKLYFLLFAFFPNVLIYNPHPEQTHLCIWKQ